MSENNFWGAWLVPTQKIRGSFWIIHTKKAKRTSFENQKKPFHQCYGCICVVCFKPKIAHFQAKASISCAVNWISIVENMNSKRKLSQERDECSSSSEKKFYRDSIVQGVASAKYVTALKWSTESAILRFGLRASHTQMQ